MRPIKLPRSERLVALSYWVQIANVRTPGQGAHQVTTIHTPLGWGSDAHAPATRPTKAERQGTTAPDVPR